MEVAIRRFAKVGAFVALACAVGVLAGVVWVDRALAAVHSKAGTICLTSKDRNDIAAGKFTKSKQDTLVAKAINFDQGRTRMSWWHLRSAAIHVTYVTFWSPGRRRREFDLMTSRMRDCPEWPTMELVNNETGTVR